MPKNKYELSMLAMNKTYHEKVGDYPTIAAAKKATSEHCPTCCLQWSGTNGRYQTNFTERGEDMTVIYYIRPIESEGDK